MGDDTANPFPSDIDVVPEIERRFALLEDRFGQLKSQVRQAMQMSTLGSASAVWAHELNNLITPMLSYAQYALGKGDVPLMEKALGITVENSKTIMAMSERILSLSARHASPSPESVDVRAAVEYAVACLGRNLQKDGITLTVDIPDGLKAWTDPHGLRQVLFNLILNAHNAMAPTHGGTLTIRAHSPDDQSVVLCLTDTGGGISPDRVEGIFESFSSSKASTRDGQARCGGVGLSLSRQILEDGGGSIDVTSEPGVGTTFTITLPRSAPSD